jgi:hypothetical protein
MVHDCNCPFIVGFSRVVSQVEAARGGISSLQNMLEFTFNRLAPNLAIQRLSVDSTITTAIIICGMLGLDFP